MSHKQSVSSDCSTVGLELEGEGVPPLTPHPIIIISNNQESRKKEEEGSKLQKFIAFLLYMGAYVFMLLLV
jgi:hypothetical protein